VLENGQLLPDFDEICYTDKDRHAEFNITKAGVWVKFQDDRSRHVGNSSACYKVGSYYPIFVKIDTQAETDMLNAIDTKSGSVG
jgi:hypothetical protein